MEWQKLTEVLFTDVKRMFDHVSKTSLIISMINLGIDEDLISYANPFLTDQKIQFVIDGHENNKKW